jgi:hypothetical protein
VFAFEARTATMEGLALAASKQWGNYSIVTSEGSSVEKIINGLYSSGQANVAILLDGFSGGPINDIRVQSESRLATRSAINMVLLGQDDVTEKMTASQGLDAYGFFSRMLYYRVAPGVPPEVPVDAETAGEAWSDWSDAIDTIADCTPWPEPIFDLGIAEATGEILRPWPEGYDSDEMLTLEWAPEAAELFLETSRRISPLVNPQDATRTELREAGDFLNKVPGILARVACYLHALHNPGSYWREPVPEDRLRGAIEVIRFYLPGWYELMPSRREEASLAGADDVLVAMKGRVGRWIGRRSTEQANGASFGFTWGQIRHGVVKGGDEAQTRALGAALDQFVEDLPGFMYEKNQRRYIVAGQTLESFKESGTANK